MVYFPTPSGADSSAIFVVTYCFKIKDNVVLAPDTAGVHKVTDDHTLLAAWSELVAWSVRFAHRGLIGNFRTKRLKWPVEGCSEALFVRR